MIYALRPYTAVVRARFSVLLQYRAAAIAGFVTQCWWGGIKVMVLTAFFAASSGAPMSLPQAIDYVWLGQALFTMLPWSGDPDVARMVRTGDVAYERLRPLDTYAFWYSRAVARRTANPTLRALPMLLTAGVLFRLVGWSAYALRAPSGAAAAFLFVVSIALVIALSAKFGHETFHAVDVAHSPEVAIGDFNEKIAAEDRIFLRDFGSRVRNPLAKLRPKCPIADLGKPAFGPPMAVRIGHSAIPAHEVSPSTLRKGHCFSAQMPQH